MVRTVLNNYNSHTTCNSDEHVMNKTNEWSVVHIIIPLIHNIIHVRLTDIKTKLTTSTSGERTLTCSVYGIDENQANEIIIHFNHGNHKFTCDKNDHQADTKLFNNGTTCQLTIREGGNYSCIVTLGVTLGMTEPCILQQSQIVWQNNDHETFLAIVITFAGVTSLALILCITLIVTCVYVCKHQGRQRTFVNIEVHDEGILSCRLLCV